MRDYTPTFIERNLVHATCAYLELLAVAVAYVAAGHVSPEEPELVRTFLASLRDPSKQADLFTLRKYVQYAQAGLPGLCSSALEWAGVLTPTLWTALTTATALHRKSEREGETATVFDSFLTLPNPLGPAHATEWKHADPTWTHVVVKTGYLSEDSLWKVSIFVDGKLIS